MILLLQEKSKQVNFIGKIKQPEIIKFRDNQNKIVIKIKKIIFLFSNTFFLNIYKDDNNKNLNKRKIFLLKFHKKQKALDNENLQFFFLLIFSRKSKNYMKKILYQ